MKGPEQILPAPVELLEKPNPISSWMRGRKTTSPHIWVLSGLLVSGLVLGIVVRIADDNLELTQRELLGYAVGTLTLFWVIFIIRRNHQLKHELSQQNRLLLYSQIQALQAQMNPHFIFNVLSTIHHLVKQNENDQAAIHLLNLSTMIRKFLDASVAANQTIKSQTTQSVITLEHEIDLLHMYLQFEKLQYGAAFDYAIEVDPAIESENIHIPPMILHPFVENAVKHGLLPKGTKGHLLIRIQSAQNGILIDIEDNGVGSDHIPPKPHNLKKQSYGKHLVEQRVQLLNNLGFGIHIYQRKSDHTGTHVTITIEK